MAHATALRAGVNGVSSPRVPWVCALLALTGCADASCPIGTYQVGHVCRKYDAAVIDDEANAEVGEEGEIAADAGGLSPSLRRDAGSSWASQGGQPGRVDGLVEPDGAAPAPLNNPPAVECNATRACASGYACVDTKCVSVCGQTRCDPNASCAVVGGQAMCSCDGDFVAQGSPTNPSCVRDKGCTCAANATCELAPSGGRRCVCKPGYSEMGTTCVPVTCPPLMTPNATISGGISFGETATARCNTGYMQASLVGEATRTCGPDRAWSGGEIRCDAITCGAPPAVANAQATPSTAGAYNATASYRCDEGYKLNGSASITCGAQGWSPRPSCSQSSCGQPPTVTNATMRSTGTTPGSTATYTCSSGYSIRGADTISCSASGWGSPPGCAFDCPAPPTIARARVSPATPAAIGQTATVTCDSPLLLSGNATITCTASGWSSAPYCTYDCGNPPVLSNGAWRLEPGARGTYLGAVATMVCSPGYRPSAIEQITCRETGWSTPGPGLCLFTGL